MLPLAIMPNMEQIAFNQSLPTWRRRVLLKPMNCPHHCEIYNVRPWSYKDYKRYAEFGTV
jgi:threonyl-tRNA synthetase